MTTSDRLSHQYDCANAFSTDNVLYTNTNTNTFDHYTTRCRIHGHTESIQDNNTQNREKITVYFTQSTRNTGHTRVHTEQE